jgi:hypothetical protein
MHSTLGLTLYKRMLFMDWLTVKMTALRCSNIRQLYTDRHGATSQKTHLHNCKSERILRHAQNSVCLSAFWIRLSIPKYAYGGAAGLLGMHRLRLSQILQDDSASEKAASTFVKEIYLHCHLTIRYGSSACKLSFFLSWNSKIHLTILFVPSKLHTFRTQRCT